MTNASTYVQKIAGILGGWRAKKQVILILTGQLMNNHMWLTP